MKKGSKQTLQARAAISSKMKGRPKTPEQREKMSVARAAYWVRKRALEEQEARLAEELSAPLHVEHNEPKAETVTYPSRRQEFR